MEDTQWTKLDTKALSKSGTTTQDKGGVKVSQSLSPYDVPEAVRSYKDDKYHRYVIEFRYIQDEDWVRKSEKEDSPIALRIGKHSGRLYGIEFDVDRLFRDDVRISQGVSALLTSTLERLSRSTLRPGRVGHYKVVQQAVDESEPQLLHELEAERRAAAG